MSKILVVEDEENLRRALQFNLKKENYEVFVAANGEEAISLFHEKRPDLILLDLMLPGLAGWEVMRRIRSSSNVPILILTARSQEEDKIEGFNLGADDYITKPFSLAELKARIRAHLRKKETSPDVLLLGPLKIDYSTFSVKKNGQEISLTRKEFLILWELASNRERVVRSEELLAKVWGEDFFGEEQTLQVHIRRLREKLEDDPSHPQMIKTVRGVGYKFQEKY